MRLSTQIQTPPSVLSRPTSHPSLSVRLARPDELERVFRLRYQVFYQEMGASDDASLCPGLDIDAYDTLCDHLVALDGERIVGTYRLLPLGRLEGTTRRPYSASEFDIALVREAYGNNILELGRSCVDPQFRDGRVPRLLWRGVLAYIAQNECAALMGCVSVHHASVQQAHALYGALRERDAVRLELEAPVLPPFRGESSLGHQEKEIEIPPFPPLMKGYLNLGALVCGGPAMDTQFATADFLMLLDRNDLSQRHAAHLLRGTEPLSEKTSTSIHNIIS